MRCFLKVFGMLPSIMNLHRHPFSRPVSLPHMFPIPTPTLLILLFPFFSLSQAPANLETPTSPNKNVQNSNATNTINAHQSEISHQIESQLRVLAMKNPRTRFIRLSYEEAEIDPAGVPAILAYKEGELFANLVSILDLFPTHDGNVDGAHGGDGGGGEEAILEGILRA